MLLGGMVLVHDLESTMRRTLSILVIMLAAAGVLVCGAALGVGWWVAVRTVDRLDRVTDRLDTGLSRADARLGRVEARMQAVHAELDGVRVEAEALVAENPELPRVRARIEQMLDKLLPALDRADAMAESLRSVAEGLRTAADMTEEVAADRPVIPRLRGAADKIDRAAEALAGLRGRVEEVKSAAAVRLTDVLVALVREAVAGSERLADGLAAAREALADGRTGLAEWRDRVVFWVYVSATANMLVWVWIGLGQLCLIGWGRRRLARARPATTREC